MACNCIYFKRRTKKGIFYGYCTLKRSEVPLNASECHICENKEYKKYKPIKKVSKKRITVSRKTYDEVYEKCNGRCVICGTNQNLEYHHIYYRSERPDLIDDPNNGIMLCGEFANNCHKGKVHKNKKYWQPILLEMNK